MSQNTEATKLDWIKYVGMALSICFGPMFIVVSVGVVYPELVQPLLFRIIAIIAFLAGPATLILMMRQASMKDGSESG